MQEANADRKGATARARLDMFVGKWRTTGQSFAEGQRIDDPRASAVPWTSEESYEWLPGGHFLLHRWDATVGTYPFKGTEIIGFDESRGGYFSHLFDNAGNHGEYRGECEDGVWKFGEAATRSAIKISANGEEMDVVWQWTNGGREWLPLCERRGVRVQD
jgi:hypothetical protein